MRYETIDMGDDQLQIEQQPRVLVIDDDAGVLEQVRRALEPKLAVTCEPLAWTALERITNGGQFEMILCELDLPGMNGLEFLSRLTAASPAHADRTVLMASRDIDARTVSAATRYSVPVLDKPIDRRYLQVLAGWYAA